MEVCETWLARDYLRRAGRPLDIPPCGCSTDVCPPIREGEPEMTTSTEPTLTTQPDSPWLAGSIYHAWSAEDCIPDVNQLYADLEHAKASTIELFLDSEVGSEDDPEVHAERAKHAARLGWTQKHGNWDLVYTDKPGMAGWTDVYIGERHVLAKPTAAS